MNSLVRVGIKCHRLILVAHFEDAILDWPIVQTEGDLFEISESTGPIATGIVLVGVDSVVADDGRKCGPFTEPFWRPLRQEIRHKMVIGLNIVTVHPLRWDAEPAVAGDSCQQRSWWHAKRTGLDRPRVAPCVSPGGFTDEFERTSLEGPVERHNAERIVIPVGRRIAIIPRPRDLDAQHRTERHATRNGLAIVDIEPIGCATFPLPRSTSPIDLIDQRRTNVVVPARSRGNV